MEIIEKVWGNIFRQTKNPEIPLLKQIPIFSQLTYLELMKVCKILHLRKYHKNEVVFEEKEPGAGLYIVKSGKIIIYSKRHLMNKDETFLIPGDFFGEVALIDEEPRLITAIADEPSELLVFFRGDLLNLIARDPRLSSNILFRISTIMSSRLRELAKLVK